MLPLAVAFGVTLLATPVVIRLAVGRGWVAFPKVDRWHKRPTALMGGIAIYAGITAAWLGPVGIPSIAWVWFGATLMFVTGLVDDRVGVSPVAKLIAQIAAASLLLIAGHRLLPGISPLLSIPITLVWIIGITNAFNFLDNMDGMAAGVAAIAATALAILMGIEGNMAFAGAALAVSGSAVAFLFYNSTPARIFMGDCGSMMLGFGLAALTLVYSSSHTGLSLTALVVIPASVMAVPILDTALVTVRRMLVGRKVYQGGRDHSSHRLVALGLSERRAVLTLYAVAALFGALAIVFQYTDLILFWTFVAYAIIGITVFGVFLSGTRVYGPEQEDIGRRRLLGMHDSDGVVLRAAMRYKKRLVGVMVDLVLVATALPFAWYLRFEADLSPTNIDLLVTALPVVIVVKIATFHAFGLYQGMWKYAGTDEILRVVKGSLAASGLSILALLALYRFQGYSRTAFAIDFMLTTVLLVVVRTAYRGLSQYFAGVRSDGSRVIIYGAGDAGSLVLKELRQNPRHELLPVGFIDDDPAKRGKVMHGLRVLGTGDDLLSCRERYAVDEVIIAITQLDDARREDISAVCLAAGLGCRSLTLDFRRVHERRGTEGSDPDQAVPEIVPTQPEERELDVTKLVS